MPDRIRKFLSCCAVLLITNPTTQASTTIKGNDGQQDDYSTQIFDNRVRTLSLRNPDYFMAPAIIRLGSDDRLLLNFDIIGDAHEYLRYRLIHCNADWQPSRLLESEYIDGFNEGSITDYAYSSNTYVHFVNYNLIFPNDDLKILISGNYLLQVFEEDEPDEVLFQIRFSVTEDSVIIKPHLTSRTDKGFNTEWQQVDFAADLSGLTNINPYQDIVVTVTQNNRPETMRTVTNPLRIEGTNAVFEHDQNLIFPAGNEYRRFETVRIDYPGMNVDSVVFGGTNWHAYLRPDESRAYHNYVFDKTQHGRFMVNEYNATDPDLGADYVTVHFTLDAPEVIGANVYVDGDFSNHVFDERNRMTYDYDKRLYTAEIPLKQGSYNYQYVVVPKSESGSLKPSAIADPGLIEGNHFETQNEYLLLIFYRPPGSRGDRIIGFTLINNI